MMNANITLQSVVPHNLAQRDLAASEIWNTNLEFAGGKHYHISAPSGSGKTTLARVLYGIQHDYAGLLKIGQENVKDYSLKKWSAIRQEQMAIVFQELRLFEKLTARENIQIKNELTGSKNETEIEEMAHQLGIVQLLDNPTSQLSQGERQRVAIVRALCQPFKWLLLDEPFSHLDRTTMARATELIKEEVRKNEASIICLQLEDDALFDYDQKLKL